MSTFVVETHLNIRPFQYHVITDAFKYASIIYKRLVAAEKIKISIFNNLDEVKFLRSALKKVSDISKRRKIISALNFHRKQCLWKYKIRSYHILI